jgi:PAS domain S-box-containing protein
MPHLDLSLTRALRQRIWAKLPSYALAVLLVAVAISLRWLLDPILEKSGFFILLGAVLIAAWAGGVGPGLLSLVLMHVADAKWFHNPVKPLVEPNLASIVTTSAYYVVIALLGLLSQLRRAAQQRALEQQLEAGSQRERLRTTLACMADGVLVTDLAGRITLMNPAAEEMTAWPLDEANGRPWWEVFALRREDYHDDIENPIQRALVEKGVVHESMPLVLTSRKGNAIPIAYSAAPVRDPHGNVLGVVLIFRDESERRRTELALRNADRRKDEFLATLAHELRNPLAPISLGLELLKLSPDDQQAAEDVRTMMYRQTQHMVRLIDDLLDVSRITRGKLELRKAQIDLAEIVRNAVEATRHCFKEAQHHLTVRLPDRPVLMYADANRLTQVLINLLNNAAKFTPREGRIDLAAQSSGTEVVVTVSDSGIGIPEDKLDSIFEMFTQLDSTRESGHAGLGIGLTLVKRLVEMHGGSVAVHSRGNNLGTTFRLLLPALPAPPMSSNGHLRYSTAAPTAARRRILVVDDNPDALESLTQLVARMGNEVCRAHDGREAIEAAEAFQPDIVLMDLGMPNLNGYEAARHMREQPWGRDLTLIATTGWGQEEDRRRTAEAGFDRHLVKPIDVAELRELLAANR